MFLLFETIRLQDGKLHNLEFHNLRLNQSRLSLFKLSDKVDLFSSIHIPVQCKTGLYKCRVTYSNQIQSIDFELYSPRNIKSLKLIDDNEISYDYKFTNRDHLNNLLAQRSQYDEILIVSKGFITDTSFSNIAFSDGTKWFTPSTPILQGTMRNFLIKNNLILEAEIKVTDLKFFQKARLINAMLPINTAKDIEIENIGF
jgi:4-amino-4-deoxychorismate lyase